MGPTGSTFKVKSCTFQGVVTKYVTNIANQSYKIFVQKQRLLHAVQKLIGKSRIFRNYPYAKHATDVIFQQGNCSCSTEEEGKRYYSGKHHLYGWKVNLLVLLSGLAINHTKPCPGSVPKIENFRNNMFWHQSATKTSSNEKDVEDNKGLANNFEDYRGVSLDKENIEMNSTIRALYSKGTPLTDFFGQQIDSTISIFRQIEP